MKKIFSILIRRVPGAVSIVKRIRLLSGEARAAALRKDDTVRLVHESNRYMLINR